MRLPLLLMLGFFLEASPLTPAAQTFPWAPDFPCKLNRATPEGLHPEVYAALRRLALLHRITQGINHSQNKGNVHDTDGVVNGKLYTGAVDISVRCLSDSQIRMLLADLANEGFAAWRRLDGQDDWTGPPHVHAVWAGCRLKPVLRRQIESWLDGGNGLGSGRTYRFWQPSEQMKHKVQMLYRASN